MVTALFLEVIAFALPGMTQSSLQMSVWRYLDTPSRVTLTMGETANKVFITHQNGTAEEKAFSRTQ